MMEANLCLPGSLVRGRPGRGAAWRMAVVPGRFDQQTAGVGVPGLGDVPAMLGLAGGVFGRGDPQPGRKLAGVREAGEVTDLGDQPERGQSADPTELAQRLGLAGPPVMAGDLAQFLVKKIELALDPVKVSEALAEREMQRAGPRGAGCLPMLGASWSKRSPSR